MLDGTRVATKEQWLAKRKPELKELFQHYMYGTQPDAPAVIASQVLHEDKASLRRPRDAAGDRVAVRRRGLQGTRADPAAADDAERSQGPVPCFVGIKLPGQPGACERPERAAARLVMYDRAQAW